MSSSVLSFASTQTFRNALIAKNLAPYNVPGVYSPQISQLTYETNLSNSNVINSPDTYISQDPFAQSLYPLNQYGPPNGFNLNVNFNNPPLPVASNQGLYDINDTKLDLVNEFNIDAAYIQNVYGPEGGFQGLVTVTNVQVTDQIHQPYWSPPSFEPSTYSPYAIITNTDPVGDSGPLSNDSFIAKLGAERLKFAFQERVGAEIYQSTLGAVDLQSLKDPFEVSLIAAGKRPLVQKDYTITVPEFPISRAALLLAKFSSTYVPVSPIPGDYFDENTKGGQQSNQTSTALNVVNQLTGGFLGPILNLKRNPSQLFLANTGNGQRLSLYDNLDMNRYQPKYERNLGGISGIFTPILSAVDLLSQDGGYYVGTSKTEPEILDSPPNQIPVDPYGRQVPAPVYGPSEMAILYEGNETKINFGLPAKSTIDGGGIAGSFVWVSPKTKGGAGYKATPGGGTGSRDDEFNLISNDYDKSQSTNIKFKKNSILDQTQRLIDSADNVTGISKLKHVGNAINQVSKVFHDGYKEMTKGSKVISYKDDTDGSEVGIEYCRVFTKDTPYYTYADLQKSAGITTEGRRFSYSVLDSTYNLNIAPMKGEDSTNIIKNEQGIKYAKKYMFSLENLAWRTSSRPGFTYDELPDCEKGPNGGRVMWFPPYDLSFNDSSSASWNDTVFLGRTEPVYTYKNTKRSGSISWRIIVDSPSVLNVLVDKQLKGQTNKKVDDILNSFFAGCVKYDIYTLAKKFNTLSISELTELQTIVSSQQLTKEELELVASAIPTENTTVNGGGTINSKTDTKITTPASTTTELEKNFIDFAFYFENDEPGVGENTPYQDLFNAYTEPGNITTYQSNADGEFDPGSELSKTTFFFEKFVIDNFKKFNDGENSFIKQAEAILKEGGEIKMELQGATSASASPSYNKKLSERRVESVKEYLKTTSLQKYIEEKKTFQVTSIAQGEDAIVPVGESGTGGQIICTEDIFNKNNVKSPAANKYSLNAMACRRVKIKTVTIKPVTKTTPAVTTTVTDENPTVEINDSKGVLNPSPVIPFVPQVTVDIREKLKAGIGKRILRKLLSECDYFEMVKEETPFIYDSIKEKIKYFNPAFHSMTPEGLNSRLTFLNQCVRPGDTIPVIGPDGRPKFNDALNTAFGAPPILVLRIGDFYHTKIVPRELTFNYEPFIYDLNPEGIGVQPMMVKVNLNFDFIGGHGLARPIEQLQNALSFNFYANTEIYDERAIYTEDTSKLDKEIFDSIFEGEIGTPQAIEQPPQRRGGNTIGDIATTVVVEGGETGFTTYRAVADSALAQSKLYFTDLLNTAEKICKQYNLGIWKLITTEREFTKGNFLFAEPIDTIPPQSEEVVIFGKSKNLDKRLLYLETALLNDIRNGKNYIIKYMVDTKAFQPTDIDRLTINLEQYVTSFISGFDSPIFDALQSFTISQQDMIQNFRKLNVVNSRTDGKILENGTPFVYSVEGTEEVFQQAGAERNTTSDTLQELKNDYQNLGLRYNRFETFMEQQSIITNDYPTDEAGAGDYNARSLELEQLTIEDKRFFMVMCRVFSDNDKLNEFINFLLQEGLKDVRKFEKKLEKACDKFRGIVKSELKEQDILFKNIRENETYINFKDVDTYTKNKPRKFSYTTVSNTQTQSQQTQLVKDVWSEVNTDSKRETWEGKIKFD